MLVHRCDRCGVIDEPTSGRGLPTGWGTLVLSGPSVVLCEACAGRAVAPPDVSSLERDASPSAMALARKIIAGEEATARDEVLAALLDVPPSTFGGALLEEDRTEKAIDEATPTSFGGALLDDMVSVPPGYSLGDAGYRLFRGPDGAIRTRAEMDATLTPEGEPWVDRWMDAAQVNALRERHWCHGWDCQTCVWLATIDAREAELRAEPAPCSTYVVTLLLDSDIGPWDIPPITLVGARPVDAWYSRGGKEWRRTFEVGPC